MYDKVLGLLRESRAELKDECDLYPRTGRTRELSIASTKIDEAILWRQEDLRLKTPIRNECSEGPKDA
jgi:hypothetical protein